MGKKLLIALMTMLLGVTTMGCKFPLADTKKCEAVQQTIDELIQACKECDYEKAYALFADQKELETLGTEESLAKERKRCKKYFGDAVFEYAEAYQRTSEDLMSTTTVKVVHVNRNNEAVIRVETIDVERFLTKYYENIFEAGKNIRSSRGELIFSTMMDCLERAKSEINIKRKMTMVLSVPVEEVDGKYIIKESNKKLNSVMRDLGLGREEELLRSTEEIQF